MNKVAITKSLYHKLNEEYEAITGINPSQPTRRKNIAISRQCLFYILRNKYGLTFQTIGWLADKNHATIIHGCKAVSNLLDIKDSLTVDSIQVWSTVFESIYGPVNGNSKRFVNRVHRLILESGLPKGIVSNLLVSVATELE